MKLEHHVLFITWCIKHGFGYNTDDCWTRNGHFILYVYTFYSLCNTDWIANTEIDLDSNNSIIKRWRCTCISLNISALWLFQADNGTERHSFYYSSKHPRNNCFIIQPNPGVHQRFHSQILLIGT